MRPRSAPDLPQSPRPKIEVASPSGPPRPHPHGGCQGLLRRGGGHRVGAAMGCVLGRSSSRSRPRRWGCRSRCVSGSSRNGAAQWTLGRRMAVRRSHDASAPRRIPCYANHLQERGRCKFSECGPNLAEPGWHRQDMTEFWPNWPELGPTAGELIAILLCFADCAIACAPSCSLDASRRRPKTKGARLGPSSWATRTMCL